MERILVLRGGALGDFIVTLPLLATLRERWPASRIELAGNATAAELARNRGLLDAVHSQHEARWATLFGPAGLAPDFRAWLGKFDLVLNFWPDPDGELQAHFPFGAQQRFLSLPAAPAVAPAAAHYLSALPELRKHPARNFFRILPLDGGAGTADRRHAPSPIVLHPGSGSARKNWPSEKWRRLVAELPRPLMIILGEAEVAAGANAFLRPDPGVELLVERPLEDLVSRLNQCRLYVGHDSGISHLAAACGARCVLLFGPTEPACWAPPVPNVRVVRRGPDLATLAFSDVHCAVQAALADRT